MSQLFGQMRSGFAKALQLASDNAVFNDLPECSMISNVDVVSIKMKDQQDRSQALSRYIIADSGFTPITFLIRNERNRKQTIMTADLVNGQGFIVRNAGAQNVMDVKMPNHSSALGKILHPAGATLYKIVNGSDRPGSNVLYKVLKTGSDEPLMIVEKVFISLYPIGKAMGLLGTDCVYWFKRVDGTIMGYVRPKLVMKKNTLIVKFTSTQRDAQIRTAMLGTALLFVIHEAYPELGNLLRQSLDKKLSE